MSENKLNPVKQKIQWEMDCIKAMKGISNPKAFVEAAKKLVENGECEFVDECIEDSPDKCSWHILKEAFDAAKKGKCPE